jgi:hypothetical protein
MQFWSNFATVKRALSNSSSATASSIGLRLVPFVTGSRHVDLEVRLAK